MGETLLPLIRVYTPLPNGLSRENMTAVDSVPAFQALLDEAQALEEAIDKVLERLDENSLSLRRSDWAYHRLALIRVLLRDGSGGAVPAILCRGLIEEAGYWDWANSSGAGKSWVHVSASAELARLQSRADPTDDIWLQWVIPPGVRIDPGIGEMPRPEEAVKRMGRGLDPRLAPAFDLGALFGLYRLLGTFTHGGTSAALATVSAEGVQLPSMVRAVALQLASAAAVQIVVCELDVADSEVATLASAVNQVALRAHVIHKVGKVDATRQELRAARSATNPQAAGASAIGNMPSPSAKSLALACAYVDRADALWSLISASAIDPTDGLVISMQMTMTLAMEHLRVFGGAARDQIGRAFAPFPARALYEEGARLRWLVERVKVDGPTGDSLRSVLGESRHQVLDTQKWLAHGQLSEEQVDDLLQSAAELLEVEEGRLPSIDEVLTVAYDVNSGSTPSAQAVYSLLSQFTHATPIAALHLQRGNFISLSMPMFAVAAEAATTGHLCIMNTAQRIAGFDLSTEATVLVAELSDVCSEIRSQANGEHFLR